MLSLLIFEKWNVRTFCVPLAILSLCCQTNLCKRLQHKYPDPQTQTALDQRKSIRDPQ
mgnify:CR=1 FL=1